MCEPKIENGDFQEGDNAMEGDKRWCHQCRAKRSGAMCMSRNSPMVVMGDKLCKKSYCQSCLQRYYSERLSNVLKNRMWRCPSCRNICSCSQCRSDPLQDVDPQQLSFEQQDPVVSDLFLRCFSLMDELDKELRVNHQQSVVYTPAEIGLHSARSSLSAAMILAHDFLREQEKEKQEREERLNADQHMKNYNKNNIVYGQSYGHPLAAQTGRSYIQQPNSIGQGRNFSEDVPYRYRQQQQQQQQPQPTGIWGDRVRGAERQRFSNNGYSDNMAAWASSQPVTSIGSQLGSQSVPMFLQQFCPDPHAFQPFSMPAGHPLRLPAPQPQRSQLPIHPAFQSPLEAQVQYPSHFNKYLVHPDTLAASQPISQQTNQNDLFASLLRFGSMQNQHVKQVPLPDRRGESNPFEPRL